MRDFGIQLRGKPCEPFTSDLRVRVSVTGLATYPDVSVICGTTQTGPQDANTALNPTVLVEVLSPSTEEYDRGEKFEQNKKIVSLREYVLVSHHEQLIEVFGRSDPESWVRTEARVQAVARLASVDCALSVDANYEGINVP